MIQNLSQTRRGSLLATSDNIMPWKISLPSETQVRLGDHPRKLAVTQGSAIAMTILVMNPEKLLQLLFSYLPSG
jgi:hypothetical protein